MWSSRRRDPPGSSATKALDAPLSTREYSGHIVRGDIQMAQAEVSLRQGAVTREGGGLPERRFLFIMSVICALTIFAGFVPSYYLKDVFHVPPPLSVMTHVHGVIFTAWVVVFVAQAALIGYARPALHRQLGLLAAVLFGAVVAVGVTTALNAGRLGHAPPGSPAPLVFMIVPIAGIASAAALIVAALWNRARRDAHMRLMLAGFIAMTPPATHRLALGMGFPTQALWISFAIMDALLAVLALYDFRTRGRVHPAYLWSAAAYLAFEGAVLWAYSSPAWLPIAKWLVQT
jgi:hypothetical protein